MMQISWGGTAKQEAMLRAMNQRLADLTPAMRECAEATKLLIDDCFRKERDPWGKPWAPLEQSTIEHRRTGKNKRATSIKILTDTATLRASIGALPEMRALVFGTVFETHRNPKTGELGAGYAAAHQYGTRNGRIPRRAFLPVTNGKLDVPAGTPAGAWHAKVLRIVGSYIMGGSEGLQEAAE